MTQKPLVIQAPAKINLSLKVMGRREDGYHLLATHMQKVGLYDTLELRPSAEGIQLQCVGGDLPENSNNLVYKAATLFFAWASDSGCRLPGGVTILLRKNIPVAAGLGGGSSDAAATLLGLNEMLAAGCPPATLAVLGLQLGADVPFFLDPSPAAKATGIGEILEPVAPLERYPVLLVNPGLAVSTRWVYQTFALTEGSEKANKQDLQDAVGVLNEVGFPLLLCNDLERVTEQRFPEVGRIKASLLESGAKGALMTGSGSTVFGIFQDREQAEQAAGIFRKQYRQTYLIDPLH